MSDGPSVSGPVDAVNGNLKSSPELPNTASADVTSGSSTLTGPPINPPSTGKTSQSAPSSSNSGPSSGGSKPESSTYLLQDPKLREIMLSDVSVEALLGRLKQSIHTVKEVALYVKKMATIESEHSAYLKKLSRTVTDAFKRPEIKRGTCQNQVLNMMKSTDRYGDAGVTFIDTMHRIHDELNELVRSMDRQRKVTKETALRHEKTLLDAEREVEKAKAKYDTSCEELEKARTSDPNKTKLGFKNKSEDELHRRMTVAETDYQAKVDNCRRTRQELVTKLRVSTVHTLQGLILECDNALALQLVRYSNLFETLQLNRGFVIAPLKPQNSTTANLSVKEMAGKIDSELDFYNFVCSIAKSRSQLNRPPVTFQKHPALGPSKPPVQPKPSQNFPAAFHSAPSAPPNYNSISAPRTFGTPGYNNDRTVSGGSAKSTASNVPGPSVMLSTGTAKTGPILGKTPASPPNNVNQSPEKPATAQRAQFTPGGGTTMASSAMASPALGNSGGSPGVPSIPNLPTAPAAPNSYGPSGSHAAPTAVTSEYDPSKHGLAVYGTPLEDLLDYEEGTVPRVVYQCVQAIDNFGLEVDGIYRTNGNKDQVNEIRREFDIDAGAVDLLRPKDGVNDIHSVASALKQYFQQLPDPLLTNEFRQEFLNAANIADDVRRRDSIHAIINNLPDPNYTTLRYLIFHLYRVQERSNINKMDVTNLGIVWGPVLMKADYTNVGEMAVQSRAIQTILINAYAIFEAE